jgi:hypothetical protein
MSRSGPRATVPEGVIVKRLQTEVGNWANAVALQAGRVERRHRKQYLSVAEAQAIEIDLHFFLVALVRLRRCIAKVCERVPAFRSTLESHVQSFDEALPWLQRLRNASEHVDEYNLDEGHEPSVRRQQIQTWYTDTAANGGLIWGWLGERVEVDQAASAAATLVREFFFECDAWWKQHHADSVRDESR